MTRRVRRFPVPPGGNAMRQWPRIFGRWRPVKNVVVITIGRWLPWAGLKNWLYRHFLGMRIGDGATIGFMAMVDIFAPELISIGEDAVVGYNATILCHEFLVDEYRLGPVEIGRGVLIGANCTILPGVRIGDGAVVGAHSLVSRDVPPGAVVGGVPARPLRLSPAPGSGGGSPGSAGVARDDQRDAPLVRGAGDGLSPAPGGGPGTQPRRRLLSRRARWLRGSGQC